MNEGRTMSRNLQVMASTIGTEQFISMMPAPEKREIVGSLKGKVLQQAQLQPPVPRVYGRGKGKTKDKDKLKRAKVEDGGDNGEEKWREKRENDLSISIEDEVEPGGRDINGEIDFTTWNED
jgi:hypothetical protein